MTTELEPIGDRHVAFAQALIALAREHGANDLEVRFRLTGCKLWPVGKEMTGWSDARVTFQWEEGRHGSYSRALLRAESTISIKEPVHDQ